MGIILLSERPELREIQHNDRHNGAKLDHDLKHFLEFVRNIQLQEFIHEDHMPRAADRKPFRDTLDNAENNNLNEL